MKKWFVFFVGVGFTSWLLYFAIQKNLNMIRQEKTARPVAAQESLWQSQESESNPTSSLTDVGKEVEKKAPSVPEVKEPTFIEGSFQVVRLYRQ